ncbi:sensor histidine kinase [Pseudalkalibacillus decolorationis]|uniref:sensor histidine kinase n=1 Tax=Pseudalkalibacillus decolorationis TaxID=163879 RepID=UPI0021483D4F|nr:histidine kinase [Pseudalkalibacillus decolorationis]
MINQETLSIYIMICVLAPLLGSFTLLFLFIFEKRIDSLKNQATQLALEQELQRSRFEVLSQQIQPHFFFNTLNVIGSLARLDRKQDLISSIETLSKFFKHKYTSDQSLTTIRQELQYTNYYLDIQKLRFGDRLHIKQFVEPELNNKLIPSYAIQTFVENCFKHGFEKYQGPAELVINIRSYDKELILEVWNNKGEYDKAEAIPQQRREGIGLENIKERLSLLYPEEEVDLYLIEKATGTLVRMEWPIQEQST